jgi:hypothetical protein
MPNKVLIFIMKTEHKMVTLHTSQVHVHLQTANNILSYKNFYYRLLLHHVQLRTKSYDTLTLL